MAAAGVLTCSEVRGPVGAGLSVRENVGRTVHEGLQRVGIQACWEDKNAKIRRNIMNGGKAFRSK